jgi:hypothetical protein
VANQNAFLMPTTVIVESLFSNCGLVMTANRRHMMPRLFKPIIFLKANKTWWSLELVQEMLSNVYEEQLREYDYTGADAVLAPKGHDW